MSLILPENVLEKVIKCSLCKNYLSCGPTKIIEGNRIACGRCISKETGVLSLFNKIAPFALFPCVNRYEGCNKLLQYNDVEKHEKECIGGKYPCPICPPDIYPLESLQKLIHHYNQKHAYFVLKKPEISLKLEDEDMTTDRFYLYCDNVNNYLFEIYVELNGEMLSCNASVAGNRWKDVIQIIDKIYYRRVCSAYNDNSTVFKITVDELPRFKENILLKFLFQMDNVPALILDNFIPPDCGGPKHLYQNWPKILFDDRLFNKWDLVDGRDFELSNDSFKLKNSKNVNISIPIKCSFCENYFWNVKMTSKNNIYSHSHNDCMICAKCYEINNKDIKYTAASRSCYIHNDNVFSQYFDIQAPIFNMFFCCRNNCGLNFQIWRVREHEDKCFKLTNIEKVKLLFKNKIADCSKSLVLNYIKGNSFNMEIKHEKLETGKLFIVTHDDIKLILNYKIVGLKLIVEDAHEYDITKYYIKFRIFDNFTVSEEMHDFIIEDLRKPHMIVILPKSVSRSIVHINNNN